MKEEKEGGKRGSEKGERDERRKEGRKMAANDRNSNNDAKFPIGFRPERKSFGIPAAEADKQTGIF